MLWAITNVNEIGAINEKYTKGSVDATALDPSIDVEFAAGKQCFVV